VKNQCFPPHTENPDPPNPVYDQEYLKAPYLLTMSEHALKLNWEAEPATASVDYTLADAQGKDASAVKVYLLNDRFAVRNLVSGGTQNATRYLDLPLHTFTEDDYNSAEWRAVFTAADSHRDQHREHLNRRMVAANQVREAGLNGWVVNKVRVFYRADVSATASARDRAYPFSNVDIAMRVLVWMRGPAVNGQRESGVYCGMPVNNDGNWFFTGIQGDPLEFLEHYNGNRISLTGCSPAAPVFVSSVEEIFVEASFAVRVAAGRARRKARAAASSRPSRFRRAPSPILPATGPSLRSPAKPAASAARTSAMPVPSPRRIILPASRSAWARSWNGTARTCG